MKWLKYLMLKIAGTEPLCQSSFINVNSPRGRLPSVPFLICTSGKWFWQPSRISRIASTNPASRRQAAPLVVNLCVKALLKCEPPSWWARLQAQLLGRLASVELPIVTWYSLHWNWSVTNTNTNWALKLFRYSTQKKSEYLRGCHLCLKYGAF